jgi:hypothetical protein
VHIAITHTQLPDCAARQGCESLIRNFSAGSSCTGVVIGQAACLVCQEYICVAVRGSAASQHHNNMVTFTKCVCTCLLQLNITALCCRRAYYFQSWSVQATAVHVRDDGAVIILKHQSVCVRVVITRTVQLFRFTTAVSGMLSPANWSMHMF